ncbi:MAG: primosomal protein N' [Lachnospiraceae bacterium]|nr:primosomal protein N' [Lachnospiraceae bacterium]
MEGKFANIIIDISHEKLDRPFQYLIPQEYRGKILPGTCVSVPFGAGNQLKKGYVLEVTDRAEFPVEKLKQIVAVQEGEVRAENRFIELAVWMKEQYGSTLITALKTVIPVKRKVKALEEKSCHLLLSQEEAAELLARCEKKRSTAQARLLKELLQMSPLPMRLITEKLHVSSQTVYRLEKQGAIRIAIQSGYRNPVQGMEKAADTRKAAYGSSKVLSLEQQTAAEDMLQHYDKGSRSTCLIYGITGSGKTEVYLALIAGMVERGKQVIVLIPEIALTYQTLLRFYLRFGSRVSVINSSLSAGERYDQCERAKKGEIDVIIGPRSALFTPFANLGLIIIDEEHEGAYKSESMPRYHARETAEKLASMQDAFVVLGSATPSLEAYSRAKQGSYRLYELTVRQAGGQLPAVSIVDLREELRSGNRSVFSKRLQELIEDRLKKKEQIILFLNRRGYAGFVSCRACGYVMKCPHCDVALSEHREWGQGKGRLVCHYCGYTREGVSHCPDCGSKYILGFRAGTQQIEELLGREFSQARVLRMDADTTGKKESYEKILNGFANGEADILLGTQMIVKGHDFPNVTLVGILAADLSLYVNDYRAAERTFQLLAQAAGRAGRGEKSGEVVIQTYDPEHYCIRHAANQDYQSFYEEEMVYREMMLYPPAAHMLAVLAASPVEKMTVRLAEEMANRVRAAFREVPPVLQLVGPAPASIGKLQDIYRNVLYIKCVDYGRLIQVKDLLEAWIEQERQQGRLKQEMVQFDFDPIRGY